MLFCVILTSSAMLTSDFGAAYLSSTREKNELFIFVWTVFRSLQHASWRNFDYLIMDLHGKYFRIHCGNDLDLFTKNEAFILPGYHKLATFLNCLIIICRYDLSKLDVHLALDRRMTKFETIPIKNRKYFFSCHQTETTCHPVRPHELVIYVIEFKFHSKINCIVN